MRAARFAQSVREGFPGKFRELWQQVALYTFVQLSHERKPDAFSREPLSIKGARLTD